MQIFPPLRILTQSSSCVATVLNVMSKYQHQRDSSLKIKNKKNLWTFPSQAIHLFICSFLLFVSTCCNFTHNVQSGGCLLTHHVNHSCQIAIFSKLLFGLKGNFFFSPSLLSIYFLFLYFVSRRQRHSRRPLPVWPARVTVRILTSTH